HAESHLRGNAAPCGDAANAARHGNAVARVSLAESLLEKRAPRLTGQTHSTRPFRTPTNQSCRLTVASQCPRTSRILSPTRKFFAPLGTCSTPCSSEALVHSNSGRSATSGRPESTEKALSPASTIARSPAGALITVVQTYKLCAKTGSLEFNSLRP